MKIVLIVILTVLQCQIKINECTHIHERQRSHKYLDQFIYDLKEQSRNQSETQCLKTFTRILNGVKNHTLWATWIWDSMTISPVGYLTGTQYQLGNYRQCLNPPWLETHPEFRTKYCMVLVKPKGPYLVTNETDGPVNPYAAASTFTHMQRKLFSDLSRISWGLCVPESCDREFVEMFASVLLKHNYFDNDFSKTTITVQKFHLSGDRKPFSLDGYIFIVLLVALTTLAVGSTWLISYKKDVNGTVREIAHAFSMKDNYDKLTRTYPEELDVLHGIRFLAASFIVIHHAAASYVIAPLNSVLNLNQTMKTEGAFLIDALPFLVDIFFVMSGLLSVKPLMASLNVAQGSSTNAVKLIIKRYVRFAPLLAATILFELVMLTDFSSGPVWENSAEIAIKNCNRTWWLCVLMLNNYIRSNEICCSVSWSVQCDFQMSVVAIGLVYLYSKHRRAGFIAFLVVFALSLILPAATTYIYDLPPISKRRFITFEEYTKDTFVPKMYIKSHNRIGPYLIGMLVGYIMYIYDPNTYKKAISKKMSIFGAMLGYGVVIAITSRARLHSYEDFARFEEIMFAGTFRTVFAVGFGLLIICLVYGTLPLLNDFLSWKVFRPLSRLSYGIYLLHFVFMLKRYSSSRLLLDIDNPSLISEVTDLQENKYDNFCFLCSSLCYYLCLLHLLLRLTLQLVDSLGSLVLAVAFSFISWFLVEAPFNNMCNYWLKTKAIKTSCKAT